jgi:GrpB-like predicted nucleotidyltransferase (UPF0157 family)
MADPIIVVDYDPSWPERFLFFQRRIAGELGSMAVAIEHVGSTAVPDLPAKSIIDIDMLLATETEFDAVIDRLAKLGYRGSDQCSANAETLADKKQEECGDNFPL